METEEDAVMGDMEVIQLLEVDLADMEDRLRLARPIQEPAVHQIIIETREAHHLTGEKTSVICN